MTTFDADARTREQILAALPGYITPDSSRVESVGDESDWPANLSERHRAYLRNRGVGPRVAARRGVRTATRFEEIAPLAMVESQWSKTRDKSFPKAKNPVRVVGIDDQFRIVRDGEPNTAMVIPLYGAADPDTPQIHQLRFDMPRQALDKETGNPVGVIKFEAPAKAPRGVGPGKLPADIHPDMTDDGFSPLVFTEGQAKSDAILTAVLREGLDVTPVTFTGVTMPFHGPETPANPSRKRVLTEATLSLRLRGRVVYLCWDADWRTNRSVRDALINVGRLLEAEGAVVFVIDVPPVNDDLKTGIDDYLADAAELGAEVPLAQALKRAIDLDTAEAETRQYPHDDLGRSERLADEMLRLDSHRYNATRQRYGWMRWTGTHWTSDDLRSADGLAKRLARRDKDDKNAATSNAISAALNLARSAVGLGICETDLDPDPALLNTATGTVDLRTGELYPHRPQDLISRCTPAGYYPADLDRDDYGAPTWTQLLRTIIPDEQTRTWFQTAMGMAINGQLHEDLLLKIHGPGGNGKSTVFMALRQALGDYVGYANSDMLTARDGAQPHQLADLAGKRLLVIPETDEGARLHVATFKKLAGREPIKACRKYEHEFEYAPTHTAVLMTNHTLSINSTDNGTWRRLRLVPFGVKITSANAIADVDAKLAAEASGVLAWAIAGAKRYADAGYELGWCPEVEAATRQYRDDQDVLGMYVAERLVKGDDHRVKKPLMYADYTQWCLEGGSKPRSNRNFYAAMKTAGYLGDGSVVKSNGNEYVLGYALRAADRGGF